MFWAVFVASLVGSGHCAGMCGGIVAFVGGTSGDHRDWRPQFLYHAGRFLGYVTVGALAGGIGAVLDLGGEAVGIGRVAIAVAGSLMVGYGLIMLLRLRGKKINLPVPKFFERSFGSGMRKVQGQGPKVRALMVGLLTTLLPCGWLYMFAGTAAGTGSVWLGALTMAVFWLGTVPVLAAIGVGVQRLAGPVQKHVPMFSALLLVVIGLLAVFGRLDVPSFQAAAEAGSIEPACCESDDTHEDGAEVSHAATTETSDATNVVPPSAVSTEPTSPAE
ncbi:MAG: sulfite exporter TauE/SafE family protein [Planctomycetes bacterium]|nr:sulfite exporter TauE/SafE family protein [Planctomycetota bacterium]MCP4770479.1 sulfite exporter TauE/SafE family protein [Planctomycetota bacterium]MCP4859919.1 sulfite exporter TauE/SafE family protein [Planctomycetota bacterium]